MIFVHAFAGAISTQNALKIAKKKFSKAQLNVIWALGIIGGIFPDFDIVIPYFNRTIEHRRLLTHSIVPYLILLLLIYMVNRLTKNKKMKDFVNIANIVFFLGVTSHMILDYLVGGLQLFSPFINHYFGYHLPFNVDSPEWQYMYFISYYMLGEFIIALWFISIFKKIKNDVGKYLPVLFFVVSVMVTLVFMYA